MRRLRPLYPKKPGNKSVLDGGKVMLTQSEIRETVTNKIVECAAVWCRSILAAAVGREPASWFPDECGVEKSLPGHQQPVIVPGRRREKRQLEMVGDL